MCNAKRSWLSHTMGLVKGSTKKLRKKVWNWHFLCIFRFLQCSYLVLKKTEKPQSKEIWVKSVKKKPMIDIHHMELKLHYECARFAKAVSKLSILYKQVKCELIEKTSQCFEFLHDAWLMPQWKHEGQGLVALPISYEACHCWNIASDSVINNTAIACMPSEIYVCASFLTFYLGYSYMPLNALFGLIYKN